MIEIVDVSEHLIPGFHAIFDDVARERKFLARTEAPPFADFAQSVKEHIAAGVPQVLALASEAVVGWCQILPKPRPTERHCGTLSMGIATSHRGRGVGRRLLETCLERAATFGLERVELEVFSGNEAAVRLYLTAGFVREGEKTRSVKIDGTYIDILLMAKLTGTGK